MIMPKYLPPNSYFDDPAEKIDLPESNVRDLAFTFAGALHARINEWVTRGRGGVKQRALRSDISLLCICPELFRCKRPCGAWVGRQHGVCRERVRKLRKEFAREFADYIQFRGQRFLNRAGVPQKRRGRGRRGKKGPQPGPLAGA
ncbi:MAG: hypothetical protein LV481_14830 [Methylacidiphilales bacterium]|nr:hypothetical protein [Candidatus Methylacidiphilales bacterium]